MTRRRLATFLALIVMLGAPLFGDIATYFFRIEAGILLTYMAFLEILVRVPLRVQTVVVQILGFILLALFNLPLAILCVIFATILNFRLADLYPKGISHLEKVLSRIQAWAFRKRENWDRPLEFVAPWLSDLRYVRQAVEWVRRRQFQRALEAIPEHLRGASTGLGYVTGICDRNLNLELSWKVAYLAKIAVEDFRGAAEVISLAEAHGFGGAYFKRALAYALFRQNDPTWTKALDEGWQAVRKEGLRLSRTTFFDIESQGNDIWGSDDKLLSELQLRQNLIAPTRRQSPKAEFLPQDVLI